MIRVVRLCCVCVFVCVCVYSRFIRPSEMLARGYVSVFLCECVCLYVCVCVCACARVYAGNKVGLVQGHSLLQSHHLRRLPELDYRLTEQSLIRLG